MTEQKLEESLEFKLGMLLGETNNKLIDAQAEVDGLISTLKMVDKETTVSNLIRKNVHMGQCFECERVNKIVKQALIRS